MQEAIIVKGYGGFYTLRTADGSELICKTRGRLRKDDGDILIGDHALFSFINEPHEDMSQGIIEEILPRKNSLIRPKLANIDGAVLMLSAKAPAPDWLLLDKMLIMTACRDIRPLICVNKLDLLSEQEKAGLAAALDEYRKAGFDCLAFSAAEQEGAEELLAHIGKGLWFLAGNSGVGKSTLTNLLVGSDKMATGSVGEKLERGRHTTRHIEIIPLREDLLWADTPGFSLLDIPEEVKPEELAELYPEFLQVGKCRFDVCLHYREPDCAVRQAVREGKIGRSRYLRYKQLLEILKEREARY